MPRCFVCDFCDTAGSLSTVTEKTQRWKYLDGYVCSGCSYDEPLPVDKEDDPFIVDEGFDGDSLTV